jgi:hypothetical protein
MIKTRSSILSCLVISSLVFYSCTSTKKDGKASSDEPVAAGVPSSQGAGQEDLPSELRDVQTFDPAASLDQKTVLESDFYQIKKSVEENKAALDAAWHEQDRLESNVRAAKAEVEKQKALNAKKEEEEREKKRLKDIEEFEKNKAKRAKEEKAAEEEIKKLPSISKDEVMWEGIED